MSGCGLPMNVLSLFSGIGGLDLGLERAGMTTVGQVELDPFCRRVLAQHWPEVPRHDDVRTASVWWGGRSRPSVELVAGGFPCQGHSVAGRQRGIADERWGWPWFRDVIDALAPPFVLIENVPNLVRTGLLDVLADLADRGFDALWGRVPAAAMGAPHLRWRLFVLAAHTASLDGRTGWAWRPAGGGHDGAQQSPARVVNPWDGAGWALAEPHGGGRHGRAGHLGEADGRTESADRGEPLADAAQIGCGSGWLGSEDGHAEDGAPACGGGWWPTEPDVGRVAHGVPDRVDRLRALGNAVVPQVGEYVGRLMLGSVERAS